LQPRVVSREDWLVARKALLGKEKELTRARDRVSAERRALPWVKVDKVHAFDTTEGRKTLAGLFDCRSQLVVYHFMLAPDSDHIRDGSAFLADHVDAARTHFEHADLTFAAVSRAPLSRIEQVRMQPHPAHDAALGAALGRTAPTPTPAAIRARALPRAYASTARRSEGRRS
jgi:predicted dithiol-disulfide oxidoreductase (DUF899 family)